MSRSVTIGLAMLTGAALGGASVQALHAQAKPPLRGCLNRVLEPGCLLE
jgi:hypothetical protein